VKTTVLIHMIATLHAIFYNDIISIFNVIYIYQYNWMNQKIYINTQNNFKDERNVTNEGI